MSSKATRTLLARPVSVSRFWPGFVLRRQARAANLQSHYQSDLLLDQVLRSEARHYWISNMLWTCFTAVCADEAFLIVVIAILVVLLSLKYAETASDGSAPPGPWGLPIVGNLFLFGSSPHKNITKLGQHYGHVFSLKLGSRQVILLNSVDAVKEALLKNASDFSSRPPLHSFISSSRDERTVAWPVFGPKYLRNKRFTELAMRTVLGDDKHFCTTVLRETHVLIKSFLNLSTAGRFDPSHQLKSLASNLQFRFFFGNKLSDSYIKEAQFMMDGSTDFIESSAVGNSVDFMPWIKVIFKRQVQKLDDSVAELTAFVRKIYHLNNENIHHGGGTATAETTFQSSLASVVSDKTTLTFRDEMSSKHHEQVEELERFDDENMVNIIADCFGGGYEKLSTALRWAVAYLVSHQDVQTELQRELQRVKGSAPLSLQDKDELPLLDATILEILRLSSFLPFALPHCTTTDTTVSGYHISKGSIVFVNLWSCSRDPWYFDEPNMFNPYRFMDDKRLKVVRRPCFLSFSAGDRKCPGESYAKSIMFLVLGTCLQELKLTNGADPIEDTFGLTVRPKPYEIHVERTK